ncbi:DUF4752 family protein [Providencia heimbachae]|uniref:DUF4752 family protein n=1 Tax=Providencia heimbachae TaxID=333962 RepID=UPI00141934FD|nr:DUF4752 family protein [Providencia heimbachae]
MSDETYKWIVGSLSAIGYLWILIRSFEYFTGLIFEKLIKRKEKDRKLAAISEFYEAYELDKIKESQMVRVTTKYGLVIAIYRESKGNDD